MARGDSNCRPIVAESSSWAPAVSAARCCSGPGMPGLIRLPASKGFYQTTPIGSTVSPRMWALLAQPMTIARAQASTFSSALAFPTPVGVSPSIFIPEERGFSHSFTRALSCRHQQISARDRSSVRLLSSVTRRHSVGAFS